MSTLWNWDRKRTRALRGFASGKLLGPWMARRRPPSSLESPSRAVSSLSSVSPTPKLCQSSVSTGAVVRTCIARKASRPCQLTQAPTKPSTAVAVNTISHSRTARSRKILSPLGILIPLFAV